MIDAKDVKDKYPKIREKQLVDIVEHQNIKLYNLLGVALDLEIEKSLRQADFEGNQPIYDECTYKPKKKVGDKVLEWEEVRTSEEEMLNDEIMIRYKYIVERYSFDINNLEKVINKMYPDAESKVETPTYEIPSALLDMELATIPEEVCKIYKTASKSLIAVVLDAAIRRQKKDKAKKIYFYKGYSILHKGTYEINSLDHTEYNTAKLAWKRALDEYKKLKKFKVKFTRH